MFGEKERGEKEERKRRERAEKEERKRRERGEKEERKRRERGEKEERKRRERGEKEERKSSKPKQSVTSSDPRGEECSSGQAAGVLSNSSKRGGRKDEGR